MFILLNSKFVAMWIYQNVFLFFRVKPPDTVKTISPCHSDYDNSIPAKDLQQVEQLLNSLIFPENNNTNEEVERLLYSFVLPDSSASEGISGGKCFSMRFAAGKQIIDSHHRDVNLVFWKSFADFDTFRHFVKSKYELTL